MRIVKSLKEVYDCPNCGRKDYFLHNHTNDMGREYLFCACCHEEIYEDEDTCYDIDKAPDDIDDSLMEIEYELGTYEMMASTQHELLMANCMRGILEKFISVIRRMK